MNSYRELAKNIYKTKTFIVDYYYEETPNYPHKFHIFLKDTVMNEEELMEAALNEVATDLHAASVPVDHLNICAWADMNAYLDNILKKKDELLTY